MAYLIKFTLFAVCQLIFIIFTIVSVLTESGMHACVCVYVVIVVVIGWPLSVVGHFNVLASLSVWLQVNNRMVGIFVPLRTTRPAKSTKSKTTAISYWKKIHRYTFFARKLFFCVSLFNGNYARWLKRYAFSLTPLLLLFYKKKIPFRDCFEWPSCLYKNANGLFAVPFLHTNISIRKRWFYSLLFELRNGVFFKYRMSKGIRSHNRLHSNDTIKKLHSDDNTYTCVRDWLSSWRKKKQCISEYCMWLHTVV